MDTKEADEQATVVELPKEITDEIAKAKNPDDLRTWANAQKDYHQNPVFLDEVAKKIRALEQVN